MTGAVSDSTSARRPLRLWPGVVLVAIQWFLWQILPRLWSGSPIAMIGALGAMACGLLVMLWWLLFSRAPWIERLGAVALMVAALYATPWLLHESMATVGQGFMFYVYALPVLSLAFVLWAVLTRNRPDGVRRLTMAIVIVAACLVWTLVRTGGISSASADLAWRWSPTAEERLLERSAETALAPADTPSPDSEPEWPGYRGARRDGIVTGVRVETDWSASPPIELWRRPIGPGWSSFAVHGDRIYTQEQRGDDEIVSCYDATTGAPIWMHADTARFWEANAGAGPRATPTLAAGRVYSFGATGILNALDAGDGRRLWSHDVATEAGVDVPYWGFSGSPLVIDGVVVAAAAGTLVAYDAQTGTPRWTSTAGGVSHSSPQRMTLDGVDQIVLLSRSGATGFSIDQGNVLWQHEWTGFPIVQPNLTADGDLLISVNEANGLRRLSVTRGAGAWRLEERWTSIRLKPYFSDFVVHEGHAYGVDGGILAAIDVADGERRWKGGRYGSGQIVLLPEQDLLLVISEKGELALVRATPERFEEVARAPALEGKTWNHPVLVGDLLWVRNAEEMAAFRLASSRG